MEPDLGAVYGIVANIIEPDQVFRLGAKAWLAGGTGGEGWYKFQWIAFSRGSRIVCKWAPTYRFGNFRAAWVPEHLRDRVRYVRGTREEMEKQAAGLNALAEEWRAQRALRRPLWVV
jgi:hypothetical protein